ncbi:MAG: ABC transporter permease [Amoebophilaceae bacterium]|jgi:putative ABC transport system permease protein|nr:ABC transporter permease [Amoebophilaceae bacterium]
MSALYYVEEVYQNLRQHKLRSVLTGFGVAWGIFILVILLGAGEGFYHGTFRKFAGYAKNSVWFWGGQRVSGHRVLFSAPLLDKMQHKIEGIQYATLVARPYGPVLVSYLEEEYNQAAVQGVGASYAQVSQLVLQRGRFLSERDETNARLVCVVGYDIQRILFKKKDPIGQFLSVGGMYFQVVGTLAKDAATNRREQKSVFIPFHTFCETFNQSAECDEFRLALYPGAMAQTIEQEVRAYLARQLRFEQSNEKALYAFNFGKETEKFNALFHGIRLFLWAVGVCLLLSGVVGVGNMMLVQVKDRTQEIGIRRVLGASAREILVMILSESIFISLTAGIVGMVAGVGAIYLLNRVLDYMDPTQSLLMAHLVFKLSSAVVALLLLIIAGAVAGIMPAKRAINILPINALNTE